MSEDRESEYEDVAIYDLNNKTVKIVKMKKQK